MTLETKGKSKITAKDVLAARRLKAANPEMSMQAIKDKLGLEIHVVMVGRAIRGITHAHLDMCGLDVRPMEHREGTAAPSKKAANGTGKAKPAKKAKKAAKKAPKPAKKRAKATPAQVDGKTKAAGDGKSE